MASGNSGKVRTRAQVEAFKQKLEALVRLEGPNEVMKKISEQPIQRIIDKLKQHRLSTVGNEETLRVRLWRARCRALPNSGQLDVPWDPETDEEPEQEQKSLNETIVQTKNQEMEVDGAQGGGAPPAPVGDVFTSQMMEELAEIVRREVNTAVAREIGKLSRGEARADTVGATVNLGLRGSPPRNSNSTPKVERPPRKVRRGRATLGDFAAEGERFSSTPWESKMPLGLPLGYLGVKEAPSDDSGSDSEQDRASWRDRRGRAGWSEKVAMSFPPPDYARAEQRWKWARMLRDTGLTFSGAKDKLGAESFLARLERYRTKGAIPQEDMLFAVDALLVGEAQVWYESVEHKLHSWQDFERRFRRSFASQATPEELLTELQRRTQGKGEDINTYLTNFRYLCSRFREPLPYENQVAIAFRGIRPEYRNFMAHREINSFSALEKAGKEYEKLCRINAYWHEPVTHANQLHPSAAYKPVQAKQCAAVEVSSPKAEDGASKKSKKKTSPKKKATPPPSSPPKEVAALEKTQLSQSGRHRGRRTQWKNSNLHPSGGAIRKELSCNNCKRQGHWTTNCPAIEFFRCHKKGHMTRACPEAEENTGKSDVACQGCGQRGVTVTNCDRCGYLFDRSGNEQGEARGRSPRL
uniref:CCHC-type domain-containing protein n=2 Tax=Trichogramma kaykai TaxID=54128 RepID=A0ABD2X252_9HYME